MKKFFSLIIILVLILFIFGKSKVHDAYTRGYTYVRDFFISQKDDIDINDSLPEIAASLKKAVTPGALKVIDRITPTASKAQLSNSKVIVLTNEARRANGNLPALKENAKLNQSALLKARDMLDKQYFEHVSPSGVGVSDLGKAVGYEYIYIGENLALGGFEGDKALVDAWMASPGHRANILNDHYTEIGVAVIRGTYEGRQVWMAVQHFGAPRSLCPVINESLKSVIESDQAKIKILEADLNARKVRIDSGETYQGKTTDEQIDEYNVVVKNYNQLVNDVKQKISVFNAEVRAFNQCLSAA
jgi:uncharacterized protein YkwD